MPSLSRFNFSCCGLVFTALLMLPAMVLANSGQFQATMTVRAGCSTTTLPPGGADYGHLCSPSAGDFRLSLNDGRHGDGTQRYLSDGQTRVPYQLQLMIGDREWLNADRVLSIHLPADASELAIQAFSLPASPLARGLSHRDAVLATFEY